MQNVVKITPDGVFIFSSFGSAYLPQNTWWFIGCIIISDKGFNLCQKRFRKNRYLRQLGFKTGCTTPTEFKTLNISSMSCTTACAKHQ